MTRRMVCASSQLKLRVALPLAAVIGFSSVSYAQKNLYFAESHSVLLFGGEELLLVAPAGNFKITGPSGWIPQYASPLPSLSPDGEKVAWSLKFPVGFAFMDCRNKPLGCSQPVNAKYKTVMGVYSTREKSWKTYGDFCSVGSAAFSPDGTKVAFEAELSLAGADCRAGSTSNVLEILDLGNGRSSLAPATGPFQGTPQISWAPDGRHLAITEFTAAKSPGQIAVIELASRAKRTVAEGTEPSWSPKGDWIAYHAHWNRTCMLIHPDGTGAKMILDLRSKPGGWLLYDGTVWSPDEKQLLLNEEQFDGPHGYVMMIDLASEKSTARSRNGYPILGWSPIPAD